MPEDPSSCLEIHVLPVHCAWSAKTAEAAGSVSEWLACTGPIAAHQKLCKDDIFQELGYGHTKERQREIFSD
jgi:hypothetical protein